MLSEFNKFTKISKDSGLWYCECNKGLWSVCARDKDTVIREGQHYFMQYYSDGEYTGEVVSNLIKKL